MAEKTVKTPSPVDMVTVTYTNPDPDNVPELVGKCYVATDYDIIFENRRAVMKRVHAEVLVNDRANKLKFKIVE
jgi:hypothetical protein